MRVVRSESSLPLMKSSQRKPTAEDAASPSLQSFEEAFEQYWAPICRLLTRMVGDPAEAEDLTLEAMYRLYQRRPDAEPDSNVGGWLYRVATNLGLHSIRGYQ